MAGTESTSIPITVEFSGGLEMLFDNQKKYEIDVSQKSATGSPMDISGLVNYLSDHVMKDSRKELFILHGSVRPGILVLINDADWELEGEGSYQLQPKDHILFVSTLHGG